MLEKFLRKVLPFRIVRKDDYMVRFFLWGSRGVIDSNEERYGGKSLRLHHIISSDNDVSMHDHPYNFTSFILWNGYIEHTPFGQRRYKCGMINHKQATDLHRLVLNKPAWTLVWCGPRIREWGFMHPITGWHNWKEYGELYGSSKRKT